MEASFNFDSILVGFWVFLSLSGLENESNTKRIKHWLTRGGGINGSYVGNRNYLDPYPNRNIWGGVKIQALWDHRFSCTLQETNIVEIYWSMLKSSANHERAIFHSYVKSQELCWVTGGCIILYLKFMMLKTKPSTWKGDSTTVGEWSAMTFPYPDAPCMEYLPTFIPYMTRM